MVGNIVHERKVELVLVLIDGFSLISYASIIEPLRIANKLLGFEKFTFRNVSLNGSGVTSSCGLALPVSGCLDAWSKPDLVVICSSDGIEDVDLGKSLGSTLQKLERHGSRLGSVCTGSYVLAKCKLIGSRACAIHWEYLEIARETFPHCQFKSQVFVDDAGLLTASGGISPLDMMISFIDETSGKSLAIRVADIAIYHSRRDAATPQRMDLPNRIGIPNAHLIKCIDLMEQNIEEPIKMPELCRMVGISSRQMERLFRKYVDESPHGYYKSIRLFRARDLVMHTILDIQQISVATGFRSGTHFARAYKEKFSLSPTEQRASLSATD